MKNKASKEAMYEILGKIANCDEHTGCIVEYNPKGNCPFCDIVKEYNKLNEKYHNLVMMYKGLDTTKKKLEKKKRGQTMKTNIPFTFILLSLIGFAWFIDSYTRERPSELDCVEVVEYFLDHEDEINFTVDHAIRILQRSLNFEEYKNEQLQVDGI